jgi:hypothetical protein
MRKESKNWKLVKDKELFEFTEDGKRSGLLVISALENVKCEDCSNDIRTDENWQSFLKSSVVSKGFSNGYNFRTSVEFYCQNCSSDK